MHPLEPSRVGIWTSRLSDDVLGKTWVVQIRSSNAPGKSKSLHSTNFLFRLHSERFDDFLIYWWTERRLESNSWKLVNENEWEKVSGRDEWIEDRPDRFTSETTVGTLWFFIFVRIQTKLITKLTSVLQRDKKIIITNYHLIYQLLIN